jgi:hypothetical protein
MTALLRFVVPTDTILASSGGKEFRIESAQVRMTKRVLQGVGVQKITAWEPRSAWDEQSVFADTLKGVDQPVTLGRQVSTKAEDIDDRTTVITLDPAYVLSRLRATGRAARDPDSLDVALVPDAGSNFVSAWIATDDLAEGPFRPYLSLKIRTPRDSLETQNFIAARDTFYGVRRGGGPDSTALTVGTGFRYWTFLKFNLPDSIPKRATINSARLEAEVVQPGTFPASMAVTVDRLIVNATTRDTVYSPGVADEIPAGSTAFSTNIGPFIAQAWTAGQAANDGLVLRPLSSDDLLAWISLRNPRLTITYSIPPGTE